MDLGNRVFLPNHPPCPTFNGLQDVHPQSLLTLMLAPKVTLKISRFNSQESQMFGIPPMKTLGRDVLLALVRDTQGKQERLLLLQLKTVKRIYLSPLPFTRLPLGLRFRALKDILSIPMTRTSPCHTSF
jgi:hypothetical protein